MSKRPRRNSADEAGRNETRRLAAAAPGKGPSQRQLRVGELIRHEMARMLTRGEIHDDVLATHVVTVPEVRMSPDLKIATAYIMPLGGRNVDAVIEALAKHKKYIRAEIAQAVNLKYAPELRFMQDQSFAETERIERLLASEKVKRDLARGHS
jgi:ribosome-binding factor A